MLAFPSLAGAPAVYQGVGRDAIAAQCALELARSRPLVEDGPETLAPIENVVFADTLKAWLDQQCKGLRVFDFSIHVSTGTGASDESSTNSGVTIFLSNDPSEIWHQVWCLERRWKDLERAAPGLAGSALFAICSAHVWSVPIFTPNVGLGFAVHYHWQGEDDETWVLKEITEDGQDAGEIDIFRRADFDKAIPKQATFPKILSRRKLARLARRGGAIGKIAELSRSIVVAVMAEHKRQRREKIEMTFSNDYDDDGQALAYALALRWNPTDPLAQLTDDHLEYISQIGGSDTLGWFSLQPRQIPAWIAQMERRFAIVRMIDELVPLIATRQSRS
jgi:PRTRC genetic system protein F